MSEKRKLPIDRPCSACSAGDTKMEYHDHRPPFREPVASPQATRPIFHIVNRCAECFTDYCFSCLRSPVGAHCPKCKSSDIMAGFDPPPLRGHLNAAQPAAGVTPDYRDMDCPKCGRARVERDGTCEKCHWNVDRNEYTPSEGTTPVRAHNLPQSFDVRVKAVCDDAGKIIGHCISVEILPDMVDVDLGELVTMTIERYRP